MEQPLISVIVPVYKVEPYLNKCIYSIVNQTYRNLEIILVDDGSPDNCPEICDVWARKDERIRVIHQNNQGGGAARNIGLNIATGSLIAFIDSDDYIAPDMYTHLSSLLEQGADIAECGYINVYDDYALLECESGDSCTYSAQQAMEEHIHDHYFRQLVWNKLYRRKVIGDIHFPEGMRIDDEFWTYRVIANAKKLVRTSCKMYAYRQQMGSVMHLSFSLPRLQAVDAKCLRLQLMQERFPELVSQARVNLWFTCLYMGQMSLLHMDKKDQTKAFEKLLAVQKNYPLTNEDRRELPMKQRVWAILSDKSFVTACKLRNCLRIGV